MSIFTSQRIITAAVLAAIPLALTSTSEAHAQVAAASPIMWQTTPNSEVTVNLTVDNPAGPGWLAAYPCADGFRGTSNVNYVAGQTTSTAAVVRSDAAGKVCVKTMAPTEIIVDQFEVRPATAGLNVGSPARVLDTRTTGQRGQDWTLTLGTPDDVALFNLTAVAPEGPGFLTAWPCDQPMPDASNLNYVAGDPAVPNFVEAKTSAAGQVCIHSYARTDIVVDKIGAGSNPAITAHTPVRVIDSRNDGNPVRPGAPRTFHASAARSIVSFNLTVTDGAGPGWVKAWPCDQPEPSTSNINFDTGEIKANFVKVLTSASGDICLGAMTPVNVIVDQVAEDSAAQFGGAPARVYDSRTVVPPALVPVPVPVPAGTRIARVIDGDTVVLTSGETIRFIGIDAPESGTCPTATAAGNLIQSMTAGKTVTLTGGARDDHDSYGRLLRYVSVDGVDVGTQLLRNDLVVARYDGRDGYGTHPNQSLYITLDSQTPSPWIAGCGWRGTTPTTPTPPTPPSSGNDPRFGTCAEALAAGYGHYVKGVDPEYAWYIDGDKDGIACE